MNQRPTQYSRQRHQVAEHFSRAAPVYSKHDAVQQLLGHQLLQPLTAAAGGLVIDLGCGPGSLYQPLRERAQQYLGIDLSAAMLQVAKQFLKSSDQLVLADAEALPLVSSSVDVCFANMSLQWCADFAQAVKEMKRVLKPGGEAAFNLPVAGSFIELQQSWRQLDDIPHTQPFRTIEQVHADMQQAGVSDYRFSVVEHQQWFPDLKSLMQSVKGVGANFVERDQSPGLMTPRRFARLTRCYEQYRSNQGLPLTWRIAQLNFNK